jgi:hypothetical protein
MTHSSLGSPNPFAVPRQSTPQDERREPDRRRHMSLPLTLDEGSVKSFDLPAALERPAELSATEFERLTRAYVEALGLIQPKP